MADAEEDMIPASVERQRKQAELDKVADLAAIAYLDSGLRGDSDSPKAHTLQLDFALKKIAALQFKHGLED